MDGLGLLLYEMLTGRGPWVGHSAEEIADARRAGPPPPPSSLNPAVPAALDEISLRALGAVPGKRYGSAMAMATALEEFLGEGPLATNSKNGAAGVVPAIAAAGAISAGAALAGAAVAAGATPAGAAYAPTQPQAHARRAYSPDAYASKGGSTNGYGYDSDAGGYSP